MAKWIPAKSLPSIGKFLGQVAPIQSRRASLSSLISWAVISTPMLTPVLKMIPSPAIRSSRLWTTFLESFMVGMPYMRSPPALLFLSYTVTMWPALFSWSAAARPAGPDPTIATRLPVLCLGGKALIQPLSKPLSMMEHSMFLMVTGGSLMPRTQDPSQGAGQTLPVNSGKLLVWVSWLRASFQSLWNTRSLNLGMMLPRGQP